MERTGSVAIGRTLVRIPSREAEAGPAALRLRLSHLLGGTDLRPIGLPPSAVLIVRHLTTSVPIGLATAPVGARLDPAWERAARRTLEELARTAARPDRGAVPAEAGAVRFEGEAELLACLAADLAAGRAVGRWWWQTVLRSLASTGPAGVAPLLRARPAVVPAVFDRLISSGEAAAVLRAIAPAEARAIVTGMIHAFGVPEPAALDVTFATDQVGIKPGRGAAEGSVRSYEVASASSPHPPEARPAAWLPKAPWVAGLGWEQASLLGVALGLHRRPAAVREPGYWRSVRAWWAATPDHSVAGVVTHRHAATQKLPARAAVEYSTMPPADASTSEGPGALPARLAAERSDLLRADAPTVSASPTARATAANAVLAATEAPAAGQHRKPTKASADETGPSLPAFVGSAGRLQPGTDAAAESERLDDPSQSLVGTPEAYPAAIAEETQVPGDRPSIAVPASRATPVLDLQGGVETRLAGVLYLINAMYRLDLPACFEEGWALASAVGPFGVLEALGRGLLADGATDAAAVRLDRDPLWAALAALDGRDPTEPLGARCREGTFRVPTDWLAQVGDEADGRFAWAAARGWLRLWSERGYLLLDRPLEPGSAASQAKAELSAWVEMASLRRRAFATAPIADVGGPLVESVAPALRRWLALVLPYIGLRLRLALHGDRRHDAVPVLLRRRGRLYANATHVDLVMDIGNVSLPARLAGLDRDPGWLPEFGRVVRFHFEGSGEGAR